MGRGADHGQKTQQSSQSRLSFGVFKKQKSNLLARTKEVRVLEAKTVRLTAAILY